MAKPTINIHYCLGWHHALDAAMAPLQNSDEGTCFGGMFACGEAKSGIQMDKSLKKKRVELLPWLHLCCEQPD